MTTHRHHLAAIPEPPDIPEIPEIPDSTGMPECLSWIEQRAVLDRVEPDTLAAALGTCQPSAPLLIAARVGVEVADLRHAHWCALRDASKQVSVAYRAAGLARRPSLAEIERHRWAPTGRREDWLIHRTPTTDPSAGPTGIQDQDGAA